MGFVRGKINIEEMLNASNINWQKLNDSEYREIVKNWRNSFEEIAINQDYGESYDKAIYKIEEKLPFNGYLFNLPGYKHLPVVPSTQDPTYGYKVENINKIEREKLNQFQAIVCNSDFSFTCVFNHEGQAIVPEYYFEC